MTAGGVTLSSDDKVIKSPNDRRLYRYLELQNGLSALLVHDPEIYEQQHTGDDEEDESGEDSEEDEEEDEDEDDDDDDDGEGTEDDDYEGRGRVSEDETTGGRMDKSKKPSSHTKKAAAAVSVGIGSFSDPYEAQGLAHFLEHMLFMGSAEFPDENELPV